MGFTFGIRTTINFIKNVNKTAITITGVGQKLTETERVVSNVAGATTGGALLGKGSIDLAEAIVCQDGVCAVISAIGCTADALQIIASFVPGPNVTVVITMPISAFCKSFVWAWKKAKVPWGGC